MKKLNRILSPIAGTTFALLGITATPAQAILNEKTTNGVTGATLDFSEAKVENQSGTTPLTIPINDSTDASSASTLDDEGININGTTYSTTNSNIGDLFKGFGVTISVTPNTSGEPLGLFNSNCKPQGETNNLGNGDRAAESCGSSSSIGDPDLATGSFSYDSITHDTEPQGNLLIIEETGNGNQGEVGDGRPDDSGAGGTITFTFDDNIIAKFQDLVFVDDVSGSVDLNFRDGSAFQTNNFEVVDSGDSNNTAENEVRNLTDLVSPVNQEKDLESIDINFDGSGGVSAVVFSEYRQVPFEAETSFGVLIAAGYGLYRYYKHKKVASIKQETEE